MSKLLSAWIFLLVCTTGCAVHAGGGMEPTFASHIDPTIANEQARQGAPMLRSCDVIDAIWFLDLAHHAEWLAAMERQGERIPRPQRVTATVPADVLDRLDATRVAQR